MRGVAYLLGSKETLPAAFVEKEHIYIGDFGGISDCRYLSVTKDAFINQLGRSHVRYVNGSLA
jgi:hypothetical protein